MAKLDILTLLRKVVDQAMATDDPEACQLAIGVLNRRVRAIERGGKGGD